MSTNLNQILIFLYNFCGEIIEHKAIWGHVSCRHTAYVYELRSWCEIWNGERVYRFVGLYAETGLAQAPLL
jgi:hypothetical protein